VALMLGSFRKSENFSSIFLRLSFKSWRSKVEKMNEAVLASKAKTRQFSDAELVLPF